MSAEKRYYWLKLKDDFFSSMRIKKMRRLAGGDTLTIIYLKLQLKAMKTDGALEWTGLEANIFDELALDIDEEPGNVEMCLRYLLSCGLAEADEATQRIFLPWAVASVGSELSSAERVRKHREQKALQCNAEVTQLKRLCNTEIEIDKEKDKELEKESRKPPTLEEVRAYAKERGDKVDADKFYQYYSTGHWKDSEGKPVRNWKQKMITWERKDEKKKQYTTAAEYKGKQKIDLDALGKTLGGI